MKTQNEIKICKGQLTAYLEQIESELNGAEINEGQPLRATINFIRRGAPSQYMLNSIIENLIELGFDISKGDFQQVDTIRGDHELVEFQGRFSKPSFGYMGAKYTGD